MNIFKKNEKKNGNRLPMPNKVKRGYRWYCSLVATVFQNVVLEVLDGSLPANKKKRVLVVQHTHFRRRRTRWSYGAWVREKRLSSPLSPTMTVVLTSL